jgi:hypothetical protein
MGNYQQSIRRNEAGFTAKEVVVVVVVLVILSFVVEMTRNWTVVGNFVNPIASAVAGQQPGFVYQETLTRTLGSSKPAPGRPITFTVVQPTTAPANSIWIVSYTDTNGTTTLPGPVTTVNTISDAKGMVVVYVRSDAIGSGFGLTATDTTPGCIKCTDTTIFSVTK